MSRRKSWSEEHEGTSIFGLVAVALLIFWIGGSWAGVDRGLWWAWERPNTVLAGLGDVYFIFIWAAVVPAIVQIVLILRKVPRSGEPASMFGGGLLISLKAGVLEEIVWRWILVLSAPVVLKLLNIITFGLVKWINTEWLIPLANWATFGALESQLVTANWLAGAAILYAAASFRNQHAYLGLFGYVNSWFIGMVMFYLVFNHGIITAMVAHFAYDAIIFTIGAVGNKFRPRNPLLDMANALIRAVFRR